jgi:hypothetical protein
MPNAASCPSFRNAVATLLPPLHPKANGSSVVVNWPPSWRSSTQPNRHKRRNGGGARSCAVFTATLGPTLMPKIRRTNVPPAVLAHLLDRRRKWSISSGEIAALADWLHSNPEVPTGQWFKDFGSFLVCGEGELVKTFLPKGRLPRGGEML